MQLVIDVESDDDGGVHQDGRIPPEMAKRQGKGTMMRGHPQSQTRLVMHEKELLANRLLRHGLTVRQICGQLRCSPAFVRKVRVAMEESGEGEDLAIPTMAQSMH